MYVGIDNGVTGSIGVVASGDAMMYQLPVKTEQSYTKKKQQITRVDFLQLAFLLQDIGKRFGPPSRIVIERPFTGQHNAAISGARCLEAVLIAIEAQGWGYLYADSKAWQKELLPSGTKGTAELKKASRDIGIRMFPMLEEQIEKQKDADAILIAEWARRNNL